MTMAKSWFNLTIYRVINKLQAGTDPFQSSDFVPICLVARYKDDPKKVPLIQRPVIHQCNKLIGSLPYSGFCEITGCKYEVHANAINLVDSDLVDHLEKDH